MESYVSKTDEEIKKIATDIYKGIVFTSVQVKESEMIPYVFMCLCMQTPEQSNWMQENKIIVVYEYFDRSLPRSINGYPIFTSHHCLNEDDWQKVYKKYENIRNVLDNV